MRAESDIHPPAITVAGTSSTVQSDQEREENEQQKKQDHGTSVLTQATMAKRQNLKNNPSDSGPEEEIVGGGTNPTKDSEGRKRRCTASLGEEIEVLPLARVKRLMKESIKEAMISSAGPSTSAACISAEAALLMAKATALLLGRLAEHTGTALLTDPDPRGVLMHQHVATSVQKEKCFEFLSDIVPTRILVDELQPLSNVLEMSGSPRGDLDLEKVYHGAPEIQKEKSFEVAKVVGTNV